MAAMLLWAGAPLTLSGCLMFEDYPVLPQLPPELNGPMVLLPTGVKPEQRQATLQIGAACARPELYVTVDDEDQGPRDGGVDPSPNDKIHSLWFVPGAQTIAGNPVAHWGARQISATPAVFAALSSLVGDGQEHLVEVRVTDGEFSQEVDGKYVAGRPVIELPDGSKVTDPVYDVSYVWALTLENCP